MLGIKELLFLIVVFLANIIQCITGFAGTVLAMPFSMMLVGYSVAKPVLNLLGIVASVGVVATNRKSINIKELLRIIGFMLVGMLVGFGINSKFNMNPDFLYKLLGSIVILFMLLGVYNTFFKKSQNDKNETTLSTIIGYIVLIIAGVVHGMFVCGGPLLIIYASKKFKEREQFRATLSAVWIVLNSIIMVSDISTGLFNSDLLLVAGLSVLILIGAIAIGNILAKKMNNTVFMIITYILMGISGASLLIK